MIQENGVVSIGTQILLGRLHVVGQLTSGIWKLDLQIGRAQVEQFDGLDAVSISAPATGALK